MKKVEVSPQVQVMNLARETPGFSGADIMNLVNQAAIHASQKKAHKVTTEHLEWAKDKILLGAERRIMVMTEETRRNTAFHEAGHAIMALYTPEATPLYKEGIENVVQGLKLDKAGKCTNTVVKGDDIRDKRYRMGNQGKQEQLAKNVD